MTACGLTSTIEDEPNQGCSETGGNTDSTTSLDIIKGKIGDNFEITISLAGIIKTEIVKRDGYIVHVVNSSTDTLFNNGASYFKLGSNYELYEEINDYNAGNIVWNDTLVGSYMLEYTLAYFDDESGWEKSSVTV